MRKSLPVVSASLGVLLLVLWQVRPGRARPVASVSALTKWPPLTGFVDLHTHPLSNLAFGGKLFYGGVDIGSLLPADPDCNDSVRATSEAQALGNDNSTHGGWDLVNPPHNWCGNLDRKWIIHALQTKAVKNGNDPPSGSTGSPDFGYWPKWNDITHQKMWVEWIRRAYQGGLRVMVALAHNNKTLGDLTSLGWHSAGDYPTDDKSSADLQIREIQSFVRRHPDFMEIALTAADVHRIVSANKMAVVVGVEIDHIGNFQVAIGPLIPDRDPPDSSAVRAEIDRLYGEGVRYIFPIHLLDNAFGGAAAYEDLFNVSNGRESGHPWALVCADPADDIADAKGGGFTYDGGDPLVATVGQVFKTVFGIGYPTCAPGIGQKNALGLTPSGVVAIKEMMRLGMLIDVDHMSQAAAEKTLELATQYGYSINSGHGGVRVHSNERSLRAYQYAIIGRLHGMAGVGSGGTNSQDWLAAYSRVIQAMGGDTTYPPYREGTVVAGFGTDANSLVLGMPPRPGSPGSALPPSKDGSKTWNYNADGVAHYGMLWDFVADLKTLTNANGDSIGKAMVNNNLMHGADYFFRTWLLSETCGRGMEAPAPTVSGVVPNGSPVGSAVTVTITGRNFLGVRSIILSQGLAVVPVDDFAVNSATQITALIPASLTTGVVNVVVQTCAASSWPTSTVPFFATPVITSVSPTSGPFGGHTLVTVTGAGLNPYIFGGSLGGTKWMVGGTSIEGAPYCTDKACLLSTPPHKPGVADVQACIVPGACSAPTTADRFTYLGPTITSIKPSSGPVAGGTPVDIDGTMLNDVVRPQIFFGGVEASGYLGCATSGYGKSCLEAFSPPAGSPGPVHITAGAFGSLSTVSSADLFTYEPNARLIAIGCCADLWQGWVELNGFAPTGGAVISLTSSDPTAVALAAPTATVPAGNRGSYFNYTFPPTPIAKTATLTARYAGTSVSTTITVSAWPPIQIQFGAWDLGGHNVTATVTLNTPPPPGGGVVSLSSTDTSALSVPASVTVPAKSITGTFTATTNYSGKPKTVYVTATYKGASDKALVLVGELQPRRRPRPQTCAKGYSWNDIDGRCDPGTPQ